MNLANSLLLMIKQGDRQNEEHPSAEKFHFLKLDGLVTKDCKGVQNNKTLGFLCSLS